MFTDCASSRFPILCPMGLAVAFSWSNASPPNLQVNPDIVGGLIVEVGDRTIDLSVSSRIAKMNKLLTDSL
jgi:F0F1-type ATP synthase delta subunit